MRVEPKSYVDGKTAGDTKLIAYDGGWCEAIIEHKGRYYIISPTNDWLPEEMDEVAAGLDLYYMCLPETRHQKRMAHLDQIIGMVRRNFIKGGHSVSLSLVQAVARPQSESLV